MKFLVLLLIFLSCQCFSKAETPWFMGSDYPPLPGSRNSAGYGDYPPPRPRPPPPPLYSRPMPEVGAANAFTPVFPGFPGSSGLGAWSVPGLSPEAATLNHQGFAAPLFQQQLPALPNVHPATVLPENFVQGNSLRVPPQSLYSGASLSAPFTTPGASYRLPALPNAGANGTLQGQLDGNWLSNAGDQLWIQGNFFQLWSPPRTLESGTASGWQPQMLTGSVRYLPQNRMVVNSQGIELQYKIYPDGQSFVAEDQTGARLRFEKVWFNP